MVGARDRLAVTCWVVLLTSSAPFSHAQGPHITPAPGGSDPPEVVQSQVPCDVLIRYDDGTDDLSNQGHTLGGSTTHWTLSVVATTPPEGPWLVQSAGFFSEFWINPGNLTVLVRDEQLPAFFANEQIYVDQNGTWEVEFTNPICVSGDFAILLCPDVGTWGVTGEDTSNPDGRSYQDPFVCSPNNEVDLDFMIWACVTPCPPILTQQKTWGTIKGLFRSIETRHPSGLE